MSLPHTWLHNFRFYSTDEHLDFKTCSGVQNSNLVSQLPADSDTPIQSLSKEYPQSYSNGMAHNQEDLMGPKRKKQYGNNGFGPYSPPIYQQPPVQQLPYPNGYGYANQLQYPPYYANMGDGDQQQQQQQQQQVDPGSYSYSNGLSYYQPQAGPAPDADVATVASQTSSSPPSTSAVSSKAASKVKQGWSNFSSCIPDLGSLLFCFDGRTFSPLLHEP